MKNNLFASIPDYLEGKMDAVAKAQFENAVRENPELAAELALYRDMYTALKPAPEDALRKNLDILAKKHSGTDQGGKNWKLPALIISILLCVILAYWWSTHETAAPPPPVQPPATYPKNVNPAATEPVQPAEKENRQKPGIPRPAPLAAAFKPNPTLDKMIGNAYRSPDRKLKVAIPAAGAVLKSVNKKTTFTLSGIIETSEKSINEPFRALIFSNIPEAYEKFQFAWAAPLQMEKTNDGFRFGITADLELPPGLYYLIIESKTSGMVYFTERFTILK